MECNIETDYLTTVEIGENRSGQGLEGCTRQTVSRMIRESGVKTYRKGGVILVSKKEAIEKLGFKELL